MSQVAAEPTTEPTREKQTNAAAVRAVQRALDILLLYGTAQPQLGVSEIARELNLSKSTVHRLLGVLASRGFVTQDPESRQYSLGLTVLRLGRLVADGLDLRRRALPVMRRLQQRTGETVNLNVERDGARICIEKVESHQDIRHFVEIGQPLPIHSGASGKVLLAFLPPERIRQVLAGPLPSFTHRTVTRPEELERELEEIRRKGYATSSDERVVGAASVSAPVRDSSGRVVAGLTVSGPTFRFTPDRVPQFIEWVVEAASEVSRELGYSPSEDQGKGGEDGGA